MADCKDVFVALLFVASFFSSLCIMKPKHVTSDGFSVTFGLQDAGKVGESFMYSSLWTEREKKGLRSFEKSALVVLLLLCGDIETCPGPDMKVFMNTRGMKILHQNVRGLFSNFVCIEQLLDQHKKIDILSLSETHITDSNFDDNKGLFQIPGYTFTYQNRSKGKGGGVAMYIKNGISWNRRFDLERENVESIWMEIFITDTKSILISCFYRPPDTSNYLHRNFEQIFNDILLSSTNEAK